ncbi:MAG: DEAD/DEAH box helicase [Porphyromonadaceae bacterium]|nr:DEAD/DEAH box helicase [Porphyromonadaceae bacterium]
MQFKELNIIPSILKALENENYIMPTPIQEQAITPILNGRDLLGCAQTGTGKTAAFAVPILQLLSAKTEIKTTSRKIRALILTPTRELALQIFESFRTYGQYTGLRYGVLFGGVSQKPQEHMLQNGIDILVATPGRLDDLFNQRLVDLKSVSIFVLDEADHMLDMGFIHDVKKIIARIPAKRQTLLFSATIPLEILKMANSILVNPVKIAVTPESPAVEMIQQSLYFVDKKNKMDLLLHILQDKSVTSALVFSRTKHGANKIVQELTYAHIKADAIHGNKSQNARQLALDNFKSKLTRVLVATDIAARGIDIDELSHVINYELPNIPETYIHRIGRTGRAGLGGVALSFCDIEEKPFLAAIEKLTGKNINVVTDHPYPMLITTAPPKAAKPRYIPWETGVAAHPMRARISNGVKTEQKHTEIKADQGKKGIDPTKKKFHNYYKG